jgi:hypothetical protein
MLVNRGVAHLDLAEALEPAAPAEAAVQVRTALELFDRKGDLPMAQQARASLERLL